MQFFYLLLPLIAVQAHIYTDPKKWNKNTQAAVNAFVSGNGDPTNPANFYNGNQTIIKDLFFEKTGRYSSLWPLAYPANVTLDSAVGWLLNAAVTRSSKGQVSPNGVSSNILQFEYVPDDIRSLSQDDWDALLITQANECAPEFPDVADYLRFFADNMLDIYPEINKTSNTFSGVVTTRATVNDANVGCYQFAFPNVQDCQEMFKLMSDNITSDVPSADYRYYYDSCALVHESTDGSTFNIERVGVTLFQDCMVSTVNSRLLSGWAGTAQTSSQDETACLVHIGAAPFCLPIPSGQSSPAGSSSNDSITGSELQTAILATSSASSLAPISLVVAGVSLLAGLLI